jgi:hypothetical protein
VVLREPGAGRDGWWRTQAFAIAASLVAVLAVAGLVRLAQRPVTPALDARNASTDLARSTRPGAVYAPAPVPVAPPQVDAPSGVVPRAPTPASRRAAGNAFEALVRFDAPPVLALTVRGGDEAAAGDVTPELTVALRAYVRGDYREAFTRFSALRAPERDLAAVHFYGGVSALKIGRPSDARRWLTVAARGTQPTSAVEAWLYLGYAHLAVGDVHGAVTALDRYIELAGDKLAAARQLRIDILATGEPDR